MLIYSAQEYLNPQIVIEWTTASELDTVGFNVLRSESEGGVLEQLNASLISPSNDPLTGGSYRFVDATVEPGITYYYYLEDIDARGASTRNGPQIVTATRSGLLEGLLAMLVCVVAGFGYFSSRQAAGNG